VTLNDLEWRNSPYFTFFLPNWIALLANYITVVEDRPIMSTKYCLPIPVFHLWPKLTHPAARSLCDSWATCIFCTGFVFPAISLKFMNISLLLLYFVTFLLYGNGWKMC